MRERVIRARTRYQTIAIYGPSGVGKSTLAATAPRPYFCDSNQGLLSIADRPGMEHVRGDDIMPETAMQSLDEVYANMKGTGEKDWSKKYDTIVFDHFDDIQAMILDNLVEKALAKDESREPDAIEQREWGIMATKLKRYLRKFKAVKATKILIISEKEDFETGKVRPNLSGQLKDQLNYFCDHVFYMRFGSKGRRYLELDKGRRWDGKFRAWWIPPEERKIRIQFDDVTTLTTLLAKIAAGPQGAPSKKRRHTTED